MKTLILGIGNPILGDDGVGVRVAEILAEKLRHPEIEVKDANTDGLGLLDIIMGYDRLILVDALIDENNETGKIYRLSLEDVSSFSPSVNLSHRVGLATAVELGRKLFPEKLPKEITIFAVGIKEVSWITEEMSDAVKESILRVCQMVMQEVGDLPETASGWTTSS